MTIIAVSALLSLIGNVLYELFSLKVSNITRNYYNDDSQWIGEREFIAKLKPQFNFAYEMVIMPEFTSVSLDPQSILAEHDEHCVYDYVAGGTPGFSHKFSASNKTASVTTVNDGSRVL